MKKNLTEIVFILDRSGSMSGLEADTIGGFNSMIEKQRKADGEALVSTVLFDNMSEVIHDRVDIRDIKSMTDRDYTARGCTALLDAIGGAMLIRSSLLLLTMTVIIGAAHSANSPFKSRASPVDRRCPASLREGSRN